MAKKYTQFRSIDRLRLVIAHLDSVHGAEGASHNATFRLSTHDLMAPVLEGDSGHSEVIELKVTCPYCREEIAFSTRVVNVYYLKARQEKSTVLSAVQRELAKVTMFVGGFFGAFFSYSPMVIFTESFSHWGIALPGALIGILVGFFFARKKIHTYTERGTNLYIGSRKLQSFEKEMDSGPHRHMVGNLTIKNLDHFDAGGHRIAVDTFVSTTRSLDEVITHYTDCALSQSYWGHISDFDDNAARPI